MAKRITAKEALNELKKIKNSENKYNIGFTQNIKDNEQNWNNIKNKLSLMNIS